MTTAELTSRIAKAINDRDLDAFASLYAPNAVVHDPAYPEPLEGRDAIREDLHAMLRAFSDLRANVRSNLESGGTAAYEGVFEGTHDGAFEAGTGSIPPSGNRVTFRGAGFVQLDAQGRILEERRYYDLAGLLTQIGVLA